MQRSGHPRSHGSAHAAPSARAKRSRVGALAVLVLLALFAAGRGAAAQGGERWVLVDVAPLAVACAQAAEPSCALVRPVGASEWRVHEADIEGFERAEAHGYRLLVRADDAHDAHAAWRLVAVLEDLPLGDLDWRIVAVEIGRERVALDAERDPRLRFDLLAGRVVGTAGCNRLTAPIAPGVGPRFAVGPVVGTLMACPDEVMRREQAVIQALEGSVAFEPDDEALRLDGAGGTMWLEPLLPERQTAAGRVWPDADLVRFADHVEDAARAGSAWAFDPLRAALTWLPALPESAAVDVRRRDTASEFAPYSVVSVTETGLLDDAVSALRDVVVFERMDGGHWRAIAATQAHRCARGEDAGWSGLPDLCP